MTAGKACVKPLRLAPAQLLNPLSLRDFPLSGGHGLHYIPAGTSVASISSEISLTLRCGGWCRPVPVRIFSSIPSPVKITWNGQTLYRYLWGISPFPVETNCPHLEHQPPFYTTVGHIPVPGEFHEGCLFPLSKDNSGLSQDFIIRIMVLARKWNIVQSLD